MKSISPIIASILIIVITVAIAGIFYAFTSGIFNSIISSSNNLVNQQSKIISFTINNVYCSNNILYFDIYNNGNIPININNSIIIFTDNNGNTISINGSNIICNNGNIIPSGSNSLCYTNLYSCYYNDTDYIKSTNFIYNGINYNYEILNNNKFIIYYTSTSSLMYVPSSNNYPITIYNTQSISTPSPFQQDIAICNGNPGYVSSFAYINYPTLFNEINSNGSNVYFATTNESAPDIYSWYEGQLSINNVTCDVWWINLPNGIPANSNITIYMYIGNRSSNYYSQYYPYVGASPQVVSGYDNGQDVFIAYGYFDNTFDGWKGYIYSGSWSPTATPNGIEMLNNNYFEATYILPPNNWNIPETPLIVEEAWYYTWGGDGNVIALFGNTNQQLYVGYIGPTYGYFTPASNLSTFAQFQYYAYYTYLKSAVTNQLLNYTSFPTFGGTVYSYLIVNSSYAQTGWYNYSATQVWAPLTLLDTYAYNVYNSTNINNFISGYTYSNLSYNPFQYGTLEIGAGTGGSSQQSYQYVEWVVARAYPPNGVMPLTIIGQVVTWDAINISNTQSISTPSPFQQDIAICNGNINIGPNFAYINNVTLFNQINPNGQNVMFFNPNSGQFLYSWYEGQLSINNVTCDVWWINLPNGIPANSNITIYMYIGNSSSNYYSQYYPYVGASPQVVSGYDNGQDVFIAYGYFDNTFDGWSGFSPTATSYGIEMLNDQNWDSNYILPPNNWNIPETPLIVEEAWYYTSGADANVIALFGNTNQQFNAYGIASPIFSGSCGQTNITGGSYTTCGGSTPASNLSTFVQFEYYGSPPAGGAAMLKSAVTDQYLNYTSFPTFGGTVYSYLIVNSSYAQAGYYYYNSNQVWAPLTLLDTYNINSNGYTYSSLNYNPFQYGTLEVSAGSGSPSYQYVEWVVARAYPPNGVMPSIYID